MIEVLGLVSVLRQDLLTFYLNEKMRLLFHMQKLKEAKGEMDPQDYIARIQEAHGDLMRLGQVWKSQEADLFVGADLPPDVMDPRPGSVDDR